MGKLNPFETHVIGIIFSGLIGLMEGMQVGRLAYNLSDHTEFVYYFGTLATAILLGIAIYIGGIQGKRKISVGYTGVPTLLGLRVGWFLLSEGHHWLPPFLMGIKAVNTQIQVSEQIVDPKDPTKLDEALSQDRLVMRARYLIKFRVTNPRQWLSVRNPLEGLHEIAQRVLRDEIAKEKGDELVTESAKSLIGENITRALEDEAQQFGVGVLEASVPTMRYPPKVEDALEKVRIEAAERVYETIDTKTALKLLKKVMKKVPGMTPQEATAFIQIERDKIKSERKVFGIENSETIVRSVVDVLERFLRKGENP